MQSNTPTRDDAPTRAGARAAQQRKRLLLLLGVVLILAAALAVVLGIIFVRGAAGGSEPEPDSTSDCVLSDLRITADPAVAGALEEIVADLGPDCADMTIQTQDSAVTATALAEGSMPDFDVWVPDSAMWPAWVIGQAELTGEIAGELVVSATVASTPVVFAATEATAATLEAEGTGFASLAQQKVAAVMPDPSTEGASSAALLALQTALNGQPRAFTGVVLALHPGVVAGSDEALAAVSAATTPTVAVTTEQALSEYGDDTLVPVYPADVKPVVSVPLVTHSTASIATLKAVDALVAATDGSARFAEHGLRDAAGNGSDATAAAADAAPAPADAVNQAEVLRTWHMLTAPSRMLSLSDVSGSMFDPATEDMRRIDLFEEAAVRAINSMPDDTTIASWVFSSRRIGAQDWQEDVPFGSLGDPAHKQEMIDSVNELDTLVGGGTGLYDSVLAAVRYLRETYEPGKVHLVLLNTDGYNEDDDGIELHQLLNELEELRDPTAPVSVIAIGYGPDTDQDALEQIAAATDGAAYQALQPTDIGTVLVDAVTQRGCRPSCG